MRSSKVILRRKALKNGYSLYLDIHNHGKRYKEYLNLHIGQKATSKESDRQTLELAERIRIKRIQELQSSNHNEPNFFPKRISLISYIEELYTRNTHLKYSTLKKKKALKLHIQKYDNRDLLFSDINQKWISGFKSYLMSYLKRATADRYFSELKTTFNQALKEGLVTTSPMLFEKRIGRDKSLPQYLTLEEIQKLAKTEIAYPEIKRAFLFSCFTSLRPSDIRQLKWKNIIYTDGKYSISFIQQKTKDEVMNPLSPQAVELLGKFGNPNEFIFNLPYETTVWRHIKKWVKDAGLSEKTSYKTSRHTFGTFSVQYGKDIYTTSKLMGHSDVKITQIYAQVVDSMKEEAVMKMPRL